MEKLQAKWKDIQLYIRYIIVPVEKVEAGYNVGFISANFIRYGLFTFRSRWIPSGSIKLPFGYSNFNTLKTMNIFVTSLNPYVSARNLCDKHIPNGYRKCPNVGFRTPSPRSHRFGYAPNSKRNTIR